MNRNENKEDAWNSNDPSVFLSSFIVVVILYCKFLSSLFPVGS